MNEAIKLAIEKGGYNPKEAVCEHRLMSDENGCPFGFHYPPDEAMILDPLFWISLGKALGWGIEPSGSIWQGKEQWKIYAHDYFELRMTGGDEEKFWKELTKHNA